MLWKSSLTFVIFGAITACFKLCFKLDRYLIFSISFSQFVKTKVNIVQAGKVAGFVINQASGITT